MAEGGCVTTNNKQLANKIRLKLSHSILRKNNPNIVKKNKFSEPWYYEVSNLGWNYRASEINCALGLSQLSRLKQILKKRESIAKLYYKEFLNFKYISFPKDSFFTKTNAEKLL